MFGPERFNLDVCTVRLSFGVQKCVCDRPALEQVMTFEVQMRLDKLHRHVTTTNSVLYRGKPSVSF
jgi:hypothetical protein